MLDLIEGNVPIIIRLKDEKDLIKISIYKNELLLGEGEFNYFNDTKWLNLISNDNINNDKMKIKIKCQIEENISNNSSYTINHPSKMYTHKKNYKSSLTNNSKKNLYLEKNNNITLSPNKIKKEKSFKSNFEKKNNSINNKTQNNNYNNRKYSSSKLKHNKSCEEGNLLPQNFLEEENQSNPLYNSMICNKKDINEINNSKINQSHKKIKGKKGIINSLNSTENKSTSSRNYNFVSTSLKENNFITKNTKNNNCKINIKKPNATINITDSGIVKKLDDKFKSIDKQIVDTNFENDLENDEIIDGNKRKVKEARIIHIQMELIRKIILIIIRVMDIKNTEKNIIKDMIMVMIKAMIIIIIIQILIIKNGKMMVMDIITVINIRKKIIITSQKR